MASEVDNQADLWTFLYESCALAARISQVSRANSENCWSILIA